MSAKSLPVALMVLGCACLGSGCSDKEEAIAPPVPSPVAVQVTPGPAVAQPTAPAVPPPGAAMATSPASTLPEAIANDGSLASYVTPHASAYFQDKDGEFVAKSAQDVVERAVVAYREIQSTKHDDSPDWPVLTDLSLLVKYKILRALPPAPDGQKFVYDVTTRKVQLAGN